MITDNLIKMHFNIKKYWHWADVNMWSSRLSKICFNLLIAQDSYSFFFFISFILLHQCVSQETSVSPGPSKYILISKQLRRCSASSPFATSCTHKRASATMKHETPCNATRVRNTNLDLPQLEMEKKTGCFEVWKLCGCRQKVWS